MFKRLFPNKEGDSELSHDAGDFASDQMPTLKRSVSRTMYRAASAQSTGIERMHNEDTLFSVNMLLDGTRHGMAFGLFIVADGMGGHQNGEVASSLAVQGVSELILDRIFRRYVFDPKEIKSEDVNQLLKEAVNEAQILIKRRVPGGGTTLTLVLILGGQLFSAHIGDSRLYLIEKNNRLSLKTKDHTLVKRLVDLGEISEAEAGRHPQRNVLYRALGQMDELEPDLEAFTMEPEEKLLICSDGLWGVLEQRRMESILENHPDLDESATMLVAAANEAGGPDNISVILVEKL